MAVNGYSRLQIRLHWAVVVLVMFQYLLHDGIVAAFRVKMDTGVPTFTASVLQHIAFGSLILILALWRLILRRERGVPPPPAGDAAWQVMLAKAVHVGIYSCLILLPLTGVVAWGGGIGAAGGIHGALRLVLLGLVLLHILGAIYGQVVQKTGIIGRMMKAAD